MKNIEKIMLCTLLSSFAQCISSSAAQPEGPKKLEDDYEVVVKKGAHAPEDVWYAFAKTNLRGNTIKQAGISTKLDESNQEKNIKDIPLLQRSKDVSNRLTQYTRIFASTDENSLKAVLEGNATQEQKKNVVSQRVPQSVGTYCIGKLTFIIDKKGEKLSIKVDHTKRTCMRAGSDEAKEHRDQARLKREDEREAEEERKTKKKPREEHHKLQARNKDFSDADLQGIDYTNSIFIEANFSRANLSDAILKNSSISEANLKKANLTKADLTRAHLERSDLKEANLTRANLSNANLEDANLEKANLERANLTHANLTRANLQGSQLIRANLTGATLEETQLRNANLTGANLTKAELISAKTEGAIFTNAIFDGAKVDRNIKISRKQRAAAKIY